MSEEDRQRAERLEQFEEAQRLQEEENRRREDLRLGV